MENILNRVELFLKLLKRTEDFDMHNHFFTTKSRMSKVRTRQMKLFVYYVYGKMRLRLYDTPSFARNPQKSAKRTI